MSTLLTPAQITKTTLAAYYANSVMLREADWQYSDRFGNSDGQIGATLQIRRPVMGTILQNNMAYAAANSNISEVSSVLVVDTTVSATMNFSEADAALRMEKFAERYIKPISRQMGAYSDALIYDAIVNAGANTNSSAFTGGLPYGQTKVQTGAQWVVFGSGTTNTAGAGTSASPGSVTSNDILRCKKLLDDMNAPREDRIAILTPLATAQLAGAQITLFNAASAISTLYRTGQLATFAGIDFFESQNPASHTNGAWAGSPVATLPAGVSAWAETGTLTTSGFTGATTINAGDVFTLGTLTGGIVAVNPYTKQSTGELLQITVTTAVASATGTDVLTIAPALITSGPYQNCKVIGSGSKALTLLGTAGATYQESVVFQKAAIGCAAIKLYAPNGMDMASVQRDEDSGFNLRLVRQFDAIGAAPGASGVSSLITRLDTAYGFKLLRPDWIVRLRCQ